MPSAENPKDPPKENDDPNEPVWTYRGYELGANQFTTAMVHFFRAEVTRTNVWRQRLDTTTNWAVVATGAVLSLAFAQNVSHIVILLNILLVTVFLIIEARRYRYYELWASRVRMMETDFFTAMLVPPFKPSPDWAETIAESLLHPQYPISELEAIGRRLRRNYLWIYLIIGLAWIARLVLYPTPANGWEDIVRHASFSAISGDIMLSIVGGFYLLIFFLTFFTIWMRSATGEVLGQYEALGLDEENNSSSDSDSAWFRRSRRRKQVMTIIITADPKRLSDRIIAEMRRSATIVSGEGAYSHEARSVLMVAITVTEISHLKAIVADVSPQSFVVTVPAKHIFGKGFMPLEDE